MQISMHFVGSNLMSVVCRDPNNPNLSSMADNAINSYIVQDSIIAESLTLVCIFGQNAK